MTDERRMSRRSGRGIYLLPNLITTLALFFGFYAVVAAQSGGYEIAAIAIFVAMVMDGLDGRVARLTNTQTDFGVQYDSIADMISFGIAPALVVYLWALEDLGALGTMWDKLGNVNEQVLANYLKNEYPQTVAVVLSKIKPDHSARVLALLPEGFAMEVVMRMLRMEAVQKEVLDDVERTLRNEFMTNLARTSRRDSHELMAEIFNNLDRQTETRFLNALEERNRESAERIKQLMFTFEDLNKLDPNGVQTLLRQIDKDRLAVALKGASEQVKNLFFSNMSERAAKIMREDMEAMGPVRLRDVDEAQTEIVNSAKELSNQGEIVLADNKGEDELVY